MKWLDLPPIWLAGFVLLSWVQARFFAFGLSFGGAWAVWLGIALILAGLGVTVMAVREMRKVNTTPIPHQTATHLVTTGVFAKSRNPIYLADVVALAGFVLCFDAVLSLLLVPILLWVLHTRFILSEEAMLRRNFLSDFGKYAQQTNR